MSIYEIFNQFAESNSDIIVTGRVDKQFVFFDIGEIHYCFQAEENDPNYFRILLRIDEEETEENANDVHRRCVTTSTNVKCGKAIIVNKKVWFTVEQIYYSTIENQTLLFRRMISILDYMYNSYNDENKENGHGE